MPSRGDAVANRVPVPSGNEFAFQDGVDNEGVMHWLHARWDAIGVDPKTGEKSNFRTFFCCWPDVLQAKACCIYNALFSPFVLAYHAFRIYVLGCLRIHLRRGFLRFCCCCCRALDFSCTCFGRAFDCLAWQHIDRRFPPCAASLGNIGGDTADLNAMKTKIDDTIWVRASKFSQAPSTRSTVGKMLTSVAGSLSNSDMVLYKDGIEASDILQGALGDCWLMAAMACMAEVRGGIDNLFITKEFDPRGKYQIQLFDGTLKNGEGAWRVFTVDDFIPCDKTSWEREGKAKPTFSQPNGNELWVMLLEKAFAKLCGSYAALEGGSTIWALRAMTGDHCRWYEKDKEGGVNWKRMDFFNVPDNGKTGLCPHCLKPAPRDKRGGMLKGTNEKYPSLLEFVEQSYYDIIKWCIFSSLLI